MKYKLSLLKLIPLFFYLLPIFDAINGFMVRRHNYYGVGSIYHMFLIILLVFVQFRNGKVFLGGYEKITIGIFCTFILSYVIGALYGGTAMAISMERGTKILCTALSIAALCRLLNEGRISSEKFEAILEYQCWVIPIITIISNLLGTYNFAYTTGKSGRIGFFTNLNETTIVLMIILSLLIRKLIYDFDLKHLILFLITESCVVLTESKAGVAAGIIFAAILFVSCFKKISLRIKTRTVLIIMFFLPIGLFLFQYVYKSIYASFLQRQSYMYNAFEANTILTYLTSGRTDRFDVLLFEPIMSAIKSGTAGILQGIFNILFGFGFVNDYYSTFEMDLFDIILYGGIIAGVLLCIYIYKIIKASIKMQKNKVNTLCLLVIIMASMFIGHMWTGGVCGIYFALFVACLTCIKPYKKIRG